MVIVEWNPPRQTNHQTLSGDLSLGDPLTNEEQ